MDLSPSLSAARKLVAHPAILRAIKYKLGWPTDSIECIGIERQTTGLCNEVFKCSFVARDHRSVADTLPEGQAEARHTILRVNKNSDPLTGFCVHSYLFCVYGAACHGPTPSGSHLLRIPQVLICDPFTAQSARKWIEESSLAHHEALLDRCAGHKRKIPCTMEEEAFFWQFLELLPGQDAGKAVYKLVKEPGDAKHVADCIAAFTKSVSLIPAPEKPQRFGWTSNYFSELASPGGPEDTSQLHSNWFCSFALHFEKTIQARNSVLQVLPDDLVSAVLSILHTSKPWMERVQATTYFDDMNSKNLLLCRTDHDKHTLVVGGLCDLDGLCFGDPLEAIGRIVANFIDPKPHTSGSPGAWYAASVVDAIVHQLKGEPWMAELTQEHIKNRILVYALANRSIWATENGLTFNEAHPGILNKEMQQADVARVKQLLHEYQTQNPC